jgi:hypothetical protein
MESQNGFPDPGELVKTLARIPDANQRGYALAERLRDMENDRVLEILKGILDHAVLGDEDSLRLYYGLLTGNLAEILGSRRMSELVELAQEQQVFDVVSVLIDIPAEGADEIPHQPFLDGGLRETPLGMRKALARRPDFRMIERIARDQDHRVIRNLLDNPRVTERDVARIAATRPVSPKVLQVIYEHRRWITRHTIKKIIILNPYTPISMSLRLLAFMQVQDLDEIVLANELDSVLREQAQRMIRMKRPNSE